LSVHEPDLILRNEDLKMGHGCCIFLLCDLYLKFRHSYVSCPHQYYQGYYFSYSQLPSRAGSYTDNTYLRFFSLIKVVL
ncbi:MAG: hypothetical protein ABRQ27_16065, partial [Clostridiaceae bacterium]